MLDTSRYFAACNFCVFLSGETQLKSVALKKMRCCLFWFANELLTVSHCRRFWLFIPKSDFERLLWQRCFSIRFILLLLLFFFRSLFIFPLFGRTLAQSFCRNHHMPLIDFRYLFACNGTVKVRQIRTHISRECPVERKRCNKTDTFMSLAASLHTQLKRHTEGQIPLRWLSNFDWLERHVLCVCFFSHAHRFW